MFNSAVKTVKSHVTSLTNTFSILLVAAVEVLIGSNVFKCPCETGDLRALANPADPNLTVSTGRRYYATSFLIWPAVAAFFMALAVSGKVLQCLIQHRYRNCNFTGHCKALQFLAANAASVLVPPVAWFTIAFMDGRYYTCAVSKLPDDCLPAVSTLNATWAANRAILERANQWHRSESQIFALTALGVGLTLLGMFVICGHMCSSLPYYQRKYMQLYREKERAAFDEVSDTTLSADLKEQWGRFFKEAQSMDWEEVSELPTGSPYELSGNKYYSAFHAWCAADKATGRPLSANSKSKVAPADVALDAHP